MAQMIKLYQPLATQTILFGSIKSFGCVPLNAFVDKKNIECYQTYQNLKTTHTYYLYWDFSLSSMSTIKRGNEKPNNTLLYKGFSPLGLHASIFQLKP